MGRLIRAVGHDLRNKLGVMKNSIYYLNMRLGHGDEKVQKHLQIMGREIGNANRLIMDLMDFALAKEPVLQKTEIKAIVADALSQASLPSHWEAATRLEDGLPSLMADARQLQRAFTNIILKVVEGAPEGGELQISAREQDGFVEVGFGAPGPSTGLRTRLIIPEENLAEILNPLRRGPSTSLRTSSGEALVSAGGTSLGIAVSKRLVERHGGTIEVRSLAGPFGFAQDRPFDKRRPEPFVPGHRTGPYGTVPKDQGLVAGLRTGEGMAFTVRLPLR